ncbi:hypothetical protein MEQU1_000756 [Malassezia equina]|uniref:Uncharacterized protein n=1 Tax=Malassezia equina TaxID=1381935 RepID=A0AAF0EBW1_9BASI|nr:hypothetical protein MEQU1_000756 [Malassezia equina]
MPGASVSPVPVALGSGGGIRSQTDLQLASSLPLSMPAREAMVRHEGLYTAASPMQGQVLNQVAGQTQPSWPSPPVVWNDPSTPLPAMAPPMNAPMINVSMATPHPNDLEGPVAMAVSSNDAKGQSYPFYTSESQSSMHSSPVAGSNSDTSQPGWDPVMYPNDPTASMGPISLHQALTQQAQNEHFKGLLKLDVNMGFAGDAKMESPTTMLQPVGPGWKKRRSASDVGPRTPSLLGPSVEAFTSPIDDLSYLIQSMGGKATSPRDAVAPSMAPTVSAPGINFESLTLQADDSPPPLHAPSTPALKPDGDMTGSSLTSCDMSVPSQELTLNPSLIQTPSSNDVIQKSMMQALQDPGLFSNATEENLTGPVRHGTKSPRPVSPYHASTRSVTPESEHSFDAAIQNEAAMRMIQWRFPFSGTHQTLHPMDAYAPSLLQGARAYEA